MPKIKVTLSIGYPGATHEDEFDIDDEDWEACETEEQKEELMWEYWKEWANNYIDGGPEVIE